MPSKIRLTFKEIIKYVLLAGLLSIIIFAWNGSVRTIDLAIYDFGFRLRSTESLDERIILVELTEENLQVSEESTISDNTLASLIEKIQAQQPRIVAFDLFRDIPVPSPNLTDEENSQAYDRLQNLFRSSSNLFGIEKVIAPKINPPKELKEKNQVGSVDLPSDRDSFIRRGYIFPKITKEGQAGGTPYLAVGLAQRYLAKQGWKEDMLPDNSLLLHNQQKSIIIKPLKTFAGAYREERQDLYGLDFLINWRKGSKLFRRISVIETTSNQIPPDLFNDRLVIIGNVSSATGDRFAVPLNRWRKTNEIGPYGVETFGVDVVAQIASSIISAALDGRPLMNPAPKLLEILLFVGSVGGIFKFTDKHRFFHQNLYLATLPLTLSMTGVLILCSFIAHRLGFWLPIAWSLTSVWIAYVALTYYLERERERDKVSALEGFNENLLHSLRNIPELISQSQNAIQDYAKEIEYTLINDELTDEDIIEIIERLETIHNTAVETEAQNNRIRKYRRTSEEFLRYCFLNVRESERLIDINQTIKGIVSNFTIENEEEISKRLSIIEQYDPKIDDFSQTNPTGGIYISSAALEIIMENLLSNATFAVNAKEKTTIDRYFPTVSFQTKLVNNNIEFIVKDNGVGIPKVYQKKIFLPFKSYHSDQTGYGLGLYLAKRIANLYKGTLKVESSEGKGSKFIFTLPIVVKRNHSRLLNNFLSFLRKK